MPHLPSVVCGGLRPGRAGGVSHAPGSVISARCAADAAGPAPPGRVPGPRVRAVRAAGAAGPAAVRTLLRQGLPGVRAGTVPSGRLAASDRPAAHRLRTPARPILEALL